ncbi:hypothetical protein L6164_025716 [Bauhinia variegata]|uniref:Uncharacterized protein n=1 Tax=Bauhinia variegata TaxID=167791 RepID=A0ACB9M1R3_BAUVA|nr:hypothetical protein L6164_025716 [Bauhinia variegata]
MAETKRGSTATASSEGGAGEGVSLKDQGNEFFKAGKYLKAAALYTQAIKQDPSNPTLYRYPPVKFSIFDEILCENKFLCHCSAFLFVVLG